MQSKIDWPALIGIWVVIIALGALILLLGCRLEALS